MLEVYCYALKKGEVDELIIMLEEKNFKLVFVDKNKLRRQLSGKSVNEIKGIVNRNLHAISYTLQIEPSFILIKDRMPWYLNNILIKVNY